MKRRQKNHQIMVRFEKRKKQIGRHPYNIRSNWIYKRHAFAKFGIKFRSYQKALDYNEYWVLRARRWFNDLGVDI